MSTSETEIVERSEEYEPVPVEIVLRPKAPTMIPAELTGEQREQEIALRTINRLAGLMEVPRSNIAEVREITNDD
jgi:hypothetical protein